MNRESRRVRLEVRGYSLRAAHFLSHPRDNEIRLLARDGRRWLEQWRMPPGGQHHQRAWVEVAELRATAG